MPVRKTTTTTTTTTTTSKNHGSPPHYRFNAWVGLLFLSFMALISIVSVTDNRQRNFEEGWSLAMTAISLSCGFLAVLGHSVFALRDRFVSSLIEFVFSIICVGCWIFALPMITTPDDGLAVNHNFQIDNANLYFSSWGAFMFAMLLLASLGNERGFGANQGGVARRWLWLTVSSMVVMAASSRMFGAVCANNQFRSDGEFCRELKMGISLGVISALFAGFMTFVLWFSPELPMLGWVGAIFSIFMLVIWGVLVAYLTFDEGPGSAVGNLFFGVWVSAIIALDLGVCYFMGYLSL